MVKAYSSLTTLVFTIIELMIVLVIMGIIATIAYPNYQQYAIKTKRTAMMAELHNIGNQIQAQKLAKGSYTNIDTLIYTGNYPHQSSTKLYTVTGTLDANNDGIFGDWLITASPKIGTQVASDGTLTLSADEIKCRNTTCGQINEWNK